MSAGHDQDASASSSSELASLLSEGAGGGAGGGAAVASGSFGFDREKAREKLRHFQLADPCGWLLEAVRAAAAAGAGSVKVEIDADDVHVWFDGTPFTRADVDEIYAALLARGGPPARQHLAVALNAAMALGPRFIRLECAPGAAVEDGVVVEMRPGRADRIEAWTAKQRGKRRDVTSTTHIWVREQFRAGTFVEFFRAQRGTKREIAALKRACVLSPMLVVVNGEALGAAAAMARAGGTARADVRVKHARGHVFLDRAALWLAELGTAPAVGGELLLLHRGLVLETLANALPGWMLGAVEVLDIARDASLGAFHRDPAFESVLDAVSTAALALLEAQKSDDGSSLDEAYLRAALRTFGRDVVDCERRRFRRPGQHALVAALLNRSRPLRTTPFLVDVAGAPVTLNMLCAELELRGRVPVTHRALDPEQQGATLDRLVVHVRDDDDDALLGAILGDERADGAPLLQVAEERARKRARFSARKAAIALPYGRWLARRHVKANTSAGEPVTFDIGLRASPAPQGLAALFIADGSLVCTKLLPCPLPGISVAVAAPFTLNDAFDDVAVDTVYSRVMRAVWHELPALFADAVDAALGTGERTGASASSSLSVDDAALLAQHAVPFLAWAANPEGLWNAFLSKLGAPPLPEQAGWTALPPLVLVGARAHPLVNLPLLPRVDGALASLSSLPRPIPVVPEDVTRSSLRHAIRAGPTLRSLLGRIGSLEVHDALARREERRARILDGPRIPPTLRHAQKFHLTLTGDRVVEGGLYVASPTSPTRVDVHILGRHVGLLTLPDAPLAGLQIVVDDSTLLPLADGHVDADDLDRLAALGLAQLGPLLELLGADLRRDGHVRSLALAALALLFPTPALRRAAASLGASRAPREAAGQSAGAIPGAGRQGFADAVHADGVAAYLELLELALFDLEDVSATVELVLEAGEVPDVGAVRGFARQAGAALDVADAAVGAGARAAGANDVAPADDAVAGGMKLATRRWRLRLAPFGGFEALTRAAREGSGAGGARAVVDAALATMPALASVPFATLGGARVTLGELVKRPAPLRYVPKNARVRGHEELELDDNERAALLAFLGPQGALADVTGELKARAAKDAFEARPVEAAKLDASLHTLVVPFDDEGVRGEIGLDALHAGDTRAHIRILRGGRPVTRHDVSGSAPCSFVAVVDDPALPMLPDFSAPSSAAHIARIVALCFGAVERGIDTVIERVERAGSGATSADCRILLERLARRKVARPHSTRERALKRAPIFTLLEPSSAPAAVDGLARRAVSLEELSAASHFGELAYAVLPPRDAQLAKCVVAPFVIAPTATERRLLAEATGMTLLDMAPAWERALALADHRRSLPLLPGPPSDAVVVVERTDGRARIRAWLAPRPRNGAVIYAGADGLLVRTASREEVPLDAFVASVECGDLVDEEWRNFALEAVGEGIAGAALDVADALVQLAQQDTPAGIGARTAARDITLALAARRDRLDESWRKRLEALSALPLFVVKDGGRISLVRALDERPPSLEQMLRKAGLVVDEPIPVVDELDPLLPPEPDQSPPPQQQPQARPPPLPRKQPEPEPEPEPEPPPPPSPQSLLAARLRETLALVKLPREAELELARLPLSVQTGNGQHCVRIERSATVVDFVHPLVQSAVDDVAAYFMLCAVVYGAVNAHLGEVTDEHEREFVARLIEHSASAR